MIKSISSKIFILIVLIVSLFTISACKKDEDIDYLALYGPNYKVENTKADQTNLYGIGHIAWSNYMWKGIDYKITNELISQMGAKSVRNWMHSNWILTSPDTYHEDNLSLMRDIVDDLLKYDFQIIGMNHSNFHKSGYPNSDSTTAKPARDLSEGSMYMQWLEDYKTTWYHIVKAFPEITYWEIDNEANNDVFFPRLEGGVFTLRQKAQIYTDMMYYASQGIHEANPNAVTVMGGLVPETAKSFLEYIYEAIKSDNSWSKFPDDYFQVASWHPYMNDFTKDKFIEFNKGVYQVILDNEGKDKKVFLTELGWSEVAVGRTNIEKFIEEAYTAVKESLPFIESIHYFRIYDDLGSTWGSVAERKFGLFMDPKIIDTTVEGYKKGYPKSIAFKFQELAGGTGSLVLYE